MANIETTIENKDRDEIGVSKEENQFNFGAGKTFEMQPWKAQKPWQYEEDGMIWFLIYTQEAGEFIIQEGREPELSYKFQDAEYKVDVYTNHLFLPKDYK